MGKRTYNILFHTHTISGIVISVALYIIFFAGSFSFFRDEIGSWQYSKQVTVLDEIPNTIDEILKEISYEHDLNGRDVELTHYYNEGNISVNLGSSKDPLLPEEKRAGAFFYYDTEKKSKSNYIENYHLGEFLYRLHFLDQIPYPYGRYLSGFVALFFLFAIITGIIVYWKKMVSNFYVFRPWAKIKTIWTDAHTALGVIGFPFQFVYALTGAFFLLKGILIFPMVMGLYDGDANTLYEELEYTHPQYDFLNETLNTKVQVNPFVTEMKEDWPNFKLTEVHIFNYGDQNMHLMLGGHLAYPTKLNGLGQRIFRMRDGNMVMEKSPVVPSSYLDGVKNMMFRLHLGDYAGYGLRIISFVLGLVSCFVILSGIMIWLVARDKKNVPEKRRRFNFQVANIYMAICLGMYPITALEFSLIRIFEPVDRAFLYQTYFVLWLVITLFFVFKKDIAFTNKWTLILGGLFGLMFPIVDGIVSRQWFWQAYAQGNTATFMLHLLWIFLGGISLWVAFFKLGTKKMERKVSYVQSRL